MVLFVKTFVNPAIDYHVVKSLASKTLVTQVPKKAFFPLGFYTPTLLPLYRGRSEFPVASGNPNPSLFFLTIKGMKKQKSQCLASDRIDEASTRLAGFFGLLMDIDTRLSRKGGKGGSNAGKKSGGGASQTQQGADRVCDCGD